MDSQTSAQTPHAVLPKRVDIGLENKLKILNIGVAPTLPPVKNMLSLKEY